MMMSEFSSENPDDRNHWRLLPGSEVDRWNVVLRESDATYRQYPYWTESFRQRGITPVYLVYGTDLRSPDAFACVLSFRHFGMLIGLLHHGPVMLREGASVDREMVEDLVEWAKTEGYVFLRVTNSEASVIDRIKSYARFDNLNAFQGLGDARNAGIIDQVESDEEMLKSFQPICRREIKAAQQAGYEIRSTDSPDAFEEAWPMFVAHAELKGFRVATRPYTELVEVFRRAQPHGLARLFTAHIHGEVIQSIVVIRHGRTAELLLGATNVKSRQREASPSCLLHWHAMREFYREGCQVYNISGPGDGTKSKVGQFKRKFRPTFIVHPPPVTLVVNPFVYRVWRTGLFRVFIPLRSRLRRLVGTQEVARKTIREVASSSN
jgi:hypothetical protein